MGSDQSTHAHQSSKGPSNDAKNFAYLSPIGSNENISASDGVNGNETNKRASTGNSSKPEDAMNSVSPGVDAARMPTLQAQLQAKVSAHVVSGVATASQKLDAASALIGRSPGKPLGQDAIIVVHSGKAVKEDSLEDDPHLRRLNDIPVCFPLLKGPSSVPTADKHPPSKHPAPPSTTIRLNYKDALMMALRHQEHLRKCADAVSFDQSSLCTRVKEIDFAVNTLMVMLTERQKKYAKLAEQVSKTGEILQTVKSIRTNLEHMVPALNNINQNLPSELKLETLAITIVSNSGQQNCALTNRT